MNDWFRSWHGAPTDLKWSSVSKRAGVATGSVVGVVWALLDRASQAENRGSIEGYDAEALGDFMGLTESEVESIVEALHQKGVLEKNVFTQWAKRQPKREDASTERVRNHREQKKNETLRNAPEANETQCNAVKRNVTLDTDTDKIRSSLVGAKVAPEPHDAFEVAADALTKIGGIEKHPVAVNAVIAPIWQLVQSGWSLQTEIIPSIKQQLSKARPGAIKSWGYFVPGILETRAAKINGSASYVNAVEATRWLEHARKHKTWGKDWGGIPGKSGCIIPPDLLKPGDGDDWRIFDALKEEAERYKREQLAYRQQAIAAPQH